MARTTRHPKHSSPDPDLLAELVQGCLTLAASEGAESCEAAAAHDQGLSVNVRLGEVETVEYQNDRSIGVTVYIGHRKGSASTADFSKRAIEETVTAACRIARYTAEDPHMGLADPGMMATEFPDLDLDHPWELSPERAVALATECENSARDADARIVNSEGAGVSTHRGMRCLGNSNGFLGAMTGTHHSVSCVVIAGTGDEMQRDWWYSTARRADDMDDVAAVGSRAAQRAVDRLGSRRLSTRQAPVLFTPEVSRGLITHFLSAITGHAQYRKSSFLLGALNSPIFPSWLQMVEEPHQARGPASASFDGEGVATRDRVLVEDGVLRSYLLDSYSARRLGMATTGHAGGWTNVTVPGDGDLDALIGRMHEGLVVTELMGQGVNQVTGDYSRGAAGYWVENGRIVHPVEEVTVAGNLRDILQSIVAVGSDHDHRHALRVGSVIIERMSIAGQ
jgi:PmbA protein